MNSDETKFMLQCVNYFIAFTCIVSQYNLIKSSPALKVQFWKYFLNDCRYFLVERGCNSIFKHANYETNK